MSVQTDNVQQNQNTEQQTKQNDKEYNFAQIRQQLERERQEKLALQQELEKVQRLAQERIQPQDEDDDDEPYVDTKRLEKKLSKFEQKLDQKIDQQASVKAQKIFEEYQKEQWLKNNPDYAEVMNHAQKFADSDSEYAETILKMPEGFERNKLVYKAIKNGGFHKPPETKASIQSKVDQNRRNVFYQPSDVAAAPYQMTGDFSDAGKKNAHAKMKEMQARLRGFPT